MAANTTFTTEQRNIAEELLNLLSIYNIKFAIINELYFFLYICIVEKTKCLNAKDMNRLKNLFATIMIVMMSLGFVSCNSNDYSGVDNVDYGVQSPATTEYLCSALLWFYAPDKGIGKEESYENFCFYRINTLTGCTISGVGECKSGKYKFTFIPPHVYLKEIDDLGNEKINGKTRTLTVYKLTKKNYNQKFLLIDGKQYIGGVSGGIDL